MSLIIKCADVSKPVAAYGFSVRFHHRLIHVQGGVGEDGDEALRQALAWLAGRPGAPGAVTIRTTAPCAGGLEILTNMGWAVDLQTVSAEWVSEAQAIAQRVALGASALPPARPKRHRRAWSRPARSVSVARQTAARYHCTPTPADLVLICDGGYKPLTRSRGLAAYGFVARADQELLHREKGIVCHGPAAGSQMAELGAVVAALRWLAAGRHHSRTVELRNDCQGVVYRLTGRCRMRLRRGSVMLERTAAQLLQQLDRQGCRIALKHIPRKFAAEADSLCRRVYKTQPKVPITVQAFLRQTVVRAAAGGHPES